MINRRRARQLAMQAIYQWQFNANPIATIEYQLTTQSDTKKTDLPYFTKLVNGIIQNLTTIDEVLSKGLDRPIAEISLVELAILRQACYELLYETALPFKIVINEALEIAKRYGSDMSYKYVNGVLDKIVKLLKIQ